MASTEARGGKRQGTELEKFKRRMIRSVARRIKEKKTDEELWEEMKKEIGSNCKKLWTRMRMLTLKKLKRLLEADDRVDLIGPVARMTLTDWLLFDLVIVHEKIDVIDREKLTGSYKSAVLSNLFSLVQRFEIEGRRGDNLAEAWTAATVYYNSKGHQCSPMMLQRRWFQLKELTRHKFYKFWFSYRGNQRQLSAAKQDSPNELQKSIALRYPQIITKKFLTWEEGIENRLVILPDELGVKMRQRNLMKPSDTSVPDVVLIEPHVETIDLGNISDSEEDDQNEASDPQPVVKVKNEPVDLDEADEEFQIPPEKGSEFDEEIQRLQMAEEHFDKASHNVENPEDEVVDPGQIDDSVHSPSDIAIETEDNSTVGNFDIDAILIDDDEDDSNPQEYLTEQTEPVMTSDAEKDNNINESNVIAEITSVTSVGIKVENIDDVIEIDRTDSAEMLPVISTVSGAGIKVEHDVSIPKEMSVNIDVPMATVADENDQSDITDTLPVISTISSKGVKIEVEPIDEIEDISPNVHNPTDITDDKDEAKVNDLDEFGDNNMDFNIADEGIDFADDGIAYVEEDDDDIVALKDEPLSDTIKTEIEHSDDEEDKDEESTDEKMPDAQKFDLKLLMYPVVYTTKLDAMPVFDDISKYTQVHDKESIYKIYALSKPYSKQSVTGSEQVINTEETDTNDSNNAQVEKNDSVISDDDLFRNKSVENDSDSESDIVDDSQRVKLSSYLLQKPKRRSYNPVVLCKNPDFNTRLKKLSVGFFMSTRNRTLLQSCIPVTIDMNKAFENKLINGTLYLKSTPHDTKFVNKQDDIEVTSAALVKPTTVQQSLMNIDDTLEIELKKRMAERVRAINLPDISQVRRLNQHLLTAEVNPLRLQEAQDKIKQKKMIGPACYIQNIKDDINNLLSQQKAKEVPNQTSFLIEKQPPPQIDSTPQTSQPMVTINSPIVEDVPQIALPSQVANKDTEQTEDPKLTTNALNKTRKRHQKKKYPTLAWNCRPYLNKQSKNQEIHQTDALLTIDTLYKMLSALDPNLKKSAFIQKDKQPKKKVDEELKKLNINEENQNKNKTTQAENSFIDITEDETTLATSATPEAPAVPAKKSKQKEKVFSTIIRLKDREYCCWFSYRLDYIIGNLRFFDSKRRHKCKTDDCKCCCKSNFIKTTLQHDKEIDNQTLVNSAEEEKTDQKISLSIESVVSQSKSAKQTADASIQIDLDDETQVAPVSDVSLSTAVLTRTADAVEDKSLNSSNDATAELTPLPPKKIPIIRVYTAPPKHADKPDPIINKPLDDVVPEPVENTHTEPKKRFVRRIFNSRAVPDQNKSMNIKPMLLNSELCTCRPNISKVNKGLIEINGRNNCVMHKREIKESKIVMNKKLASKDIQQFFVGKGKILLTNVRMPNPEKARTLSVSPIVEKTSPTIQPTEVQTFHLPTGVQVVLLPDQTLTYVIQPEVTLTPEEYALLPQFLVAIQQQINATGITLPTSHTVPKTDEVIDLDDENSPNELDTDENITKETNIDILPTESIAIPKGNKSKIEAQTNEVCELSIDNNLSEQKNVTPEIGKVNTQSFSSKENVEISPANENPEPKPSDSGTDNLAANENPEPKTSDSGTDNLAERDTTSENNEMKSSTDDAANKKSLLSDLMEMSGIMEEDLAPVPPVIATTQQPIILDTQNFVLQREVPRDQLVTQTVESSSPSPQPEKQQYTATNKNGTFELTAITSFAELKYACDNDGVFFKLNLDTGSLTSINVCIQKFPTKVKRTISMIDLTDDPDISITGSTEGDSPTNQHSVVLNEVHEQSPPKIQISTILQKKQRLMERLSNNLKPVNIQQSKKHVARILKRNKTWHRDSQFPFYSKKKLEKIEAKIDLVDSDAPMEEEYLVNSDDSSDDEPLIKKVKRKRVDDTNDELPIDTICEPNQDKQSEPPPIFENEQANSDPGPSVQNTSLAQTNQSYDSETNEQVSLVEECQPNVEQEQFGDKETVDLNDEQEEYLDEYDSDDAGQISATPMPVPTNLVLSGGALNAHNIPLNTTYRDGEESQDEDCILGV